MQVLSVIGAVAILAAFAANQLGWLRPSQPSYAIANLVGAGILTVVAVVDGQVGFVVLQGTWTLISLWGIARILRGDASFPSRGVRTERERATRDR